MNRQTKRVLATLGVLAVGWLAQQVGLDLGALSAANPQTPTASVSAPSAGEAADRTAVERIEAAVAARESGFMVTVDAQVEKLLPDDDDGSRHQRFLIELEGGRTLLVAHNIDLADRIDLERNDRVRVRGQYEWNERGGVLHWTHHDPQRRHPGGWIEHAGRRVE